jgi:peptidoglycan-associated lipoprotein
MDKKFYKILFLIVPLLMLIGLSDGFTQEKRLKRADELYAGEEYYLAMKSYQSLIRKIKEKNLKAELYYKIGECYFNINDYKKAKTNYRRARRNADYEYLSYYKLGLCQKLSGSYEEAITHFESCLALIPDDSMALQGVESCQLALQWIEERSRFHADKVKEFNSRENDFSPTVAEKDGFDHVYFSSTRKEAEGKKTSGITGEKFADLFVCKLDRKGDWSEPEPLDSLNTIYDEGTPFISSDGRDLYYTSCEKEKGKKRGCQIMKAARVDGIWMNPERIDIVGDSISIGHPSVSDDGNTIYFSSRKTGGFGGADLWYVEKTDDGWGRPRNMGPAINTKGDELFPFMRADGVLYFSSDRHPNMGGLDIYKAYKNEFKKWVVVNLKPPFNSEANDFGIYYYADQDKGYFTSDRRGSKKEDIYYFEKPVLNFSLTGTVRDIDTKRFIDSAVIVLYGSDGSMFTDTSFIEDDGFFSFKLKPNTDYVFSVTCKNYFNGKGRITTDTLDFDYTFEKEIFLETTNKTFEIPNIEFEFGQWDLTENSKQNLNQLIQLLRDNPYIVIELSAHTDMIGTEEANNELSEKRIKSVVNYLDENGIQKGRLIGRGFGETRPKIIVNYNEEYPWLKVGTELNEEFIFELDKEKQTIANQMNRRIEFKVLSNDYTPSLD